MAFIGKPYKPGRHDFSHFLTQGFTGWYRPKPRRQRVSLGLSGYLPKHTKAARPAHMTKRPSYGIKVPKPDR